jgi:toxin CptA
LTPCRVVLKPSPALAAALLALHGLAAAAALTSFSGASLWLILTGLAVSAACSIADALLRLPSSVLWFDLHEEGRGRWQDRAGREHSILKVIPTWLGAGMVVLGLNASRWKTRWLVLLPDAAEAEALRRLRVWLKWRPV